jgi:hypothetical protein
VGVELYQYISTSMQSFYAGLGDWFFRLEAFPQLPDNTQQYLQRYFRGKGDKSKIWSRRRDRLSARTWTN